MTSFQLDVSHCKHHDLRNVQLPALPHTRQYLHTHITTIIVAQNTLDEVTNGLVRLSVCRTDVVLCPLSDSGASCFRSAVHAAVPGILSISSAFLSDDE